MNSATILEYLKNRVAVVDMLVQQQRWVEARSACCEIVAEARLLQHQLKIEEPNNG